MNTRFLAFGGLIASCIALRVSAQTFVEPKVFMWGSVPDSSTYHYTPNHPWLKRVAQVQVASAVQLAGNNAFRQLRNNTPPGTKAAWSLAAGPPSRSRTTTPTES